LRVPYPAVPCQVSRFFSGRVRLRRALVERVLRCVLANDVRCILRGRRRRVVVHLVWDLGCRLRDQFVLVAVRERLREGPASDTFRAV